MTSKRKSPQSKRSPTRLKELIDLVKQTADAKGWESELVAIDKKGAKYATVAVNRIVPGSHAHITGTFEIMCDKQVSIAPHGTSFYKHGLSDLQAAIANELSRLPWLEKSDTKVLKPQSVNRTGIPRDFNLREDGVYGNKKSVFSGSTGAGGPAGVREPG